MVGVDGVSDAADADEDEAGVGKAGANSHGEGAADLDALGAERGDGRSGSQGAILVEKVRWREDLAIRVVDELVAVGGAAADALGDVAETTAAAEDAAVGKQDADRVVVAWDGLGCQYSPSLGVRVEDFRVQGAVIIGEHLGPALTTADDDATIRQNNGVGETTGVGHVSDALNLCGSVGLIDGRDVSAGVGVRVSVVRRTASTEDLSSSRVIHDKDTAHGVINGVSDTSSHLRALACRSVPVHSPAGSSLEYRLVLPAKEPCVVVLTPDALVVPGKHGADLRVWQSSPGVGSRVVNLTVLAHAGTRVCTANGEDAVVGSSTRRLVSTSHFPMRVSTRFQLYFVVTYMSGVRVKVFEAGL